jgi:hypothetical protein
MRVPVSSPRLQCFPSSDVAFATVVARALADTANPTMRSLELRLRGRYPGVRVRRRELSGEPGETWYVYRDGHL